jgi:hypothetical protein
MKLLVAPAGLPPSRDDYGEVDPVTRQRAGSIPYFFTL